MKLYFHNRFYIREIKELISKKLKYYNSTFGLWYYSFQAGNWDLQIKQSAIFSPLVMAALEELEVRNDLYTRWVNLTHGMELYPDINLEHRQNENGILYLAEYFMYLHQQEDLTIQDKKIFEIIVDNLKYEDAGVYNRGQGESTLNHKYYESPETRRTISQDNITAISCGSYLLGNKNECVAIAKHGIKNFFVYNNIKPLYRFPLNPGNISTWLALAGYTKSALVFLPIYVINFIITMSKPAGNTSSKKLYMLELYTLREVFGFKTLGRIMGWRLKKQYGENYAHAIYSIYYPEGHPLIEITK